MRRERIRRNHTATHLLHWALRLVLGEHVKQSGSFVAPERLRFDFTHFEAPTPEQLAKVERLVNAKIFEDHPVRAYETSLASAREAGVTALFGEKYGEFVRVLEIGNFSRELCGGTHVGRTSETRPAQDPLGGLGRREPATHRGGHQLRRDGVRLRRGVRPRPRRRGPEVPSGRGGREGRGSGQAGCATPRRRPRPPSAEARASRSTRSWHPRSTSATRSSCARVDAADAGALRDLSDAVRSKLADGAVVLAAANDGKALLLAAGSDAAVAAGFDAGARRSRRWRPTSAAAAAASPQMAQAGGREPAGIDDALAAAREALGVA